MNRSAISIYIGLVVFLFGFGTARAAVVRIPPVIALLQRVSPEVVGVAKESINASLITLGDLALPRAYRSTTGEMHGSQLARALMVSPKEVKMFGSEVSGIIGLEGFHNLHAVFEFAQFIQDQRKRQRLKGKAKKIYYQLYNTRRIIDRSKTPEQLQIRLSAIYDSGL